MKVEWRDGSTLDHEINVPEWVWIFMKNEIKPLRLNQAKTLVGPIEKWAPVEMPDPPEKEFHICKGDLNRFNQSYVYCVEANGQLFLKNSKEGPNCHLINFCPFCGFTLEKD